MTHDLDTDNPYAKDLAALRAAEVTPDDPLVRYAADFKLNQIIEREAEYHEIREADQRAAEAAQHLGTSVQTLRFADAAEVPDPPNPYALPKEPR